MRVFFMGLLVASGVCWVAGDANAIGRRGKSSGSCGGTSATYTASESYSTGGSGCAGGGYGGSQRHGLFHRSGGGLFHHSSGCGGSGSGYSESSSYSAGAGCNGGGFSSSSGSYNSASSGGTFVPGPGGFVPSTPSVGVNVLPGSPTNVFWHETTLPGGTYHKLADGSYLRVSDGSYHRLKNEPPKQMPKVDDPLKRE